MSLLELLLTFCWGGDKKEQVPVEVIILEIT